MTPYDCDIWISEQMTIINQDKKYFDYVIDKVLYWRLEFSKNVTFKRDRKWFQESYPIFEKMWKYVEFFRNNEEQLQLFSDYLDSRGIKESKSLKVNTEVMDLVAKLFDTNNQSYQEYLENVKSDIKKFKKKKKESDDKKQKYSDNATSYYNTYMFVDNDNDDNNNNNDNAKKIKKKKKISQQVNTNKSSLTKPSNYLFIDN